jgi:hypothetical protein
MKYIQCPEVYDSMGKSLFLAGGISGCSDWQTEMIALLKDTNLVLINPRRESFNASDKHVEEEQIAWEFEHLNKSDAVLFWFPSETVCPITLYELGKISKTDKAIFIGVDPNYSRRRDVEIQTKLVRPDVNIVYSIRDLAQQIKELNTEEISIK